MKFTKKMKNILLEMGYPEEDFTQIGQAATHTKYTLICDEDKSKKRVSRAVAISYLGLKDFLSGLARSAFHCTAYRESSVVSGYSVMFDSSKFFY